MEAGPRLVQGEGEFIGYDSSRKNDSFLLSELCELRQKPYADIPSGSAGPVPNPLKRNGADFDIWSNCKSVVNPSRRPRTFGVELQDTTIKTRLCEADIDARVREDSIVVARLLSSPTNVTSVVSHDPFHLKKDVMAWAVRSMA